MAAKKKRRFWTWFRRGFRWFRILLLLLALSFVLGAIYVTQVGLPGFVKKPLQEELRRRGLDAEFSRIRYAWFRGIVAEQLSFSSITNKSGPVLQIDEA